MNMVLGVATRRWDGWFDCVKSWEDNAAGDYHIYCVSDADVLPAFQEILTVTREPIIGYIHDDVMIYEKDWNLRVLKQFDDPFVGVVGFGGALGHGQPWLYSRPYHLPDLARQNFMSNMRNAEQHGTRFTGERDVAILDGFALFVRRDILERCGGWPVDKPVGYWMYSEFLCCEARRQGFRIRLVGVDCEHLGGKSSGFISPSVSYEEAHRYFYDNNHDVMPYRVPE